VKTVIAYLFGIFTLLIYGVYLQAHEVNTLYAELGDESSEGVLHKVTLDVYYDVSLSLEEWQGDEIPAPTREWLLLQTESTYERIKNGAVNYIAEHIELNYMQVSQAQVELLDYNIVFPDFVSSPPDFPKQRNGYAYSIVRVVWKIPSMLSTGDKLVLGWKHSDQEMMLRVDVAMMNQKEQISYTRLTDHKNYSWFPLNNDNQKGANITDTKLSNRAAYSWFKLGFSHIIPKGWDHLLFIAGLFFLARSKKELFSQSLLFTLAHSVVLVLIAFGVTIPIPAWIEIVIALSIVYIGVEAYVAQSQKSSLAKWRSLIVCFFGLIHGFAFAEILQGYFDNEDQVWLALLGFNLGIESAQIMIILGLGLISLLWAKSIYSLQVSIYVSYAIAIMGIVWLIERIF